MCKQCLIICLVNCSTHTHTFPTTPHINTVVIFSRFQLVSFETAKLNLVVCRSVSWKLLSGVLCGCTKEMIGCIAVYICCTTCFASVHVACMPLIPSLFYSCAVQLWACAHTTVAHIVCVHIKLGEQSLHTYKVRCVCVWLHAHSCTYKVVWVNFAYVQILVCLCLPTCTFLYI